MTNNPEAKAKSATLTFRAGEATMRLVALRKADDTATTHVVTADADKKHQRGMTEKHESFVVALSHLDTLATKAEKLGWTRAVSGRGFVARPDAFSALPAAPKARKA